VPDGLCTAAGRSIDDAWTADFVVKVASESSAEEAKLKSAQSLIRFPGAAQRREPNLMRYPNGAKHVVELGGR